MAYMDEYVRQTEADVIGTAKGDLEGPSTDGIRPFLLILPSHPTRVSYG